MNKKQLKLFDVNLEPVIVNLSSINLNGSHVKDESLASNINDLGLFHLPVLNRKGDRYDVISGVRRISAKLDNGDSSILVFALKNAPETLIEEIVLSENLLRKSNLAKEAESIRSLLDSGRDEKYMKKKFGINKRDIKKRLDIFKLIPEFFEKVKKEEVSNHTAFLLVKLSHEDQKKLLAKNKITAKAVARALKERTKNTLDTVPLPDFNVSEFFAGPGSSANREIINDLKSLKEQLDDRGIKIIEKAVFILGNI